MLPRSDYGVFPGKGSSGQRRAVCALRQVYEATISTIKDPAQEAARLLEPQLEQERARDSPQPPASGPQTADAGLSARRSMTAERPQRLRLGRAARLKLGCDFARVRREGQRLVTGCLIANWRRVYGPGATSRLGVVTSGKIGSAVVRNRARRLMREAFRLHQCDLAQPVDLVLIARASIVGKGFAAVEKDLLTTLRKAGLSGKTSETCR